MNRHSPSPPRVHGKSTGLRGLAGIGVRSSRSLTSGTPSPPCGDGVVTQPAGVAHRPEAARSKSVECRESEELIREVSPDPANFAGLKSVMSEWVDGGASTIHSIVETLRSCVEAGELVESSPLRLEIEACAACRPSLSLRGGVDKYFAHFTQFKRILAGMQRGAGRALRRRSYAALQHCTLVAMPEPRLYAFEVSLAWSYRGAEYRVCLFSKLQSKDWPNPPSLLGILAEVLQLLHTSNALHTVALELSDEQRRLSAVKTTLERDIILQKDATRAAERRAHAAETEITRLKETLLERDQTIADLVTEDTCSQMSSQIQKLKQENLQLAADLASATAKIAQLQNEVSKQTEQMDNFTSQTLHRETKARNAYRESLKFFEEDCKAKLEELDGRYSEVEDNLRSERLISAQLRERLGGHEVRMHNDVIALNAAVATADHVLRDLVETLTLYMYSTRKAEQSIDTVFQKKVARTANSKYAAAEGSKKMQHDQVHSVSAPVDSLPCPLVRLQWTGDKEIEVLMREEFSTEEPVFSSKYGGIQSSLAMEWQFAVEPREDITYPGEEGKIDQVTGLRFPARVAKNIDVLVQHEMALKAKLVRSEVISLRLYTGAAHGVINEALRSSPQPLALLSSPFVVTVTVLKSAITKLMRVTDPPLQRTLYRGLEGLYMPEELFNFGPGSSAGFVERGLASCSPNREVALHYAGRCNCALRKDEEDAVFCPLHMSTLFEISTGVLDSGAWLGWVSQYPSEDEYCLAAGSVFEMTGVRREQHVNIYRLSVRSSCSYTIEQLQEQRKNNVLEFGLSLLAEVRQLILRTPIAAQELHSEMAKLNSIQASFMHKYSARRCDWFNVMTNDQSAMNDAFYQLKSILESCVLSILAWLRTQEEAETTWSNTSKRNIRRMLEMALLMMQRCAEGDSGANNIQVLRRRLAQFGLKYGNDLGMAPREVAHFWWEYANVAQRCHLYPDALSAFQQDLLLRRQMVSIAVTTHSERPQICRTLCRIGNLHRLMGENSKASEVLQEAHKEALKLDSAFHPVMSDVAQAMALLYYSENKIREALLHFEESLRIKMVHFSVRHESVLEDLEHVRTLFDNVNFDKLTHRFRAMENFFWIITASTNPHCVASDYDVSLKEVVDYMRTAQRMSEATAEWGCRVLAAGAECLEEAPGIMRKVTGQVVSDVVCTGMKLFCGSAIVQRTGLRALVSLCSRYPAIWHTNASELDLEAVWRAMASHPDNAGIQEAGIRIIRELVDAVEAAMKAVPGGDAGSGISVQTSQGVGIVLNVVFSALARHRGNLTIQRSACAILLAITRNSSASTSARIALQAKESISESLRRHTTDSDIIWHGTECLKLLTDQSTAYEAFSCIFDANNSQVVQLRLELEEGQIYTKVRYVSAQQEQFAAVVASSDAQASTLLLGLTLQLNAIEDAMGRVIVHVENEAAETGWLREQIGIVQHQLESVKEAARGESIRGKLTFETLQNEYNILSQKYSGLDHNLRASVAERLELQAQIQAHIDAASGNQLQLQHESRKEGAARQESTEKQLTLEHFKNDHNILKQTNDELVAERLELRAQVKCIRDDYDRSVKRCDELETEWTQLKLQVEEFKAEGAQDATLLKARQQHQYDVEQLTAIADTYHKCLQQNLDSYENCLEKVSVYARNLHESLTVEAVTIECKLVGVLESLSEFEAATSSYAEDKYRDSGRLAQIQIYAEHLRKESTGLIDLIENSQIEIRDVGRHAVQRTMQGHSDEANTRAIIDAMLSSPMCVHTQEIGCTTLLALCQGNDKDEVMYRIAQSNGIKAVTAAMDLLIDKLTVQESGCAIMCALVVNNEELATKIHFDGGVKSVAGALQQHWTSFTTVMHAFGFLRVAASLVDLRKSMSEQIGLRSIVDGMRAYRGKALVAEYGLSVLSSLLTVYRGNIVSALGELALPLTEAVIDSMKGHLQNNLVQEYACDVLNELANHGKSILDSEKQTETIHVLLLLLDAHGSNNTLLDKGITNLNTLMHNDNNKALVASGGGVARVVSIFSRATDVMDLMSSIARTPSEKTRMDGAGKLHALITHCLTLLQQIACQPTYLSIQREGAISAVIRCMIAFPQSLEIQLYTCAALAAFAHFAANSILIIQTDAISIVSKAIGFFPDAYDLQTQALELFEILAEQAENLSDIVGKGGAKCIINCCKDEPEDEDDFEHHAETLTSACLLLAKLAVQDEYRDVICILGAIPIILNGIRRYQTKSYGAPCVEEGLKALMMLAASSKCQLSIGREGGINLALEVCRSSPHAAVIGILENGIGLLWNLAYDRQNLELICRLGGLEWVVHIMRTHKENPKLLEYGCSALWNFCVTHENQVHITRLGGISVIVDAMRRWINHGGLQASGRSALMRMPNIALLARVLESESEDKDTEESMAVRRILERRHNRMGSLSSSFLNATDMDSFQSRGFSESERAISPTKLRPGPCIGHGGGADSSAVEEEMRSDRSDVICFYCTHPKSGRVEVQFQDFRVTFQDFNHEISRIFGIHDSLGAVFVYSWMGVPTAVTDTESFHVCKIRIEDMYCGRGDQALSIKVYEHNELSSIMEAVTTATAFVQTPPEFMTKYRRSADEDSSEGDDDEADPLQAGMAKHVAGTPEPASPTAPDTGVIAGVHRGGLGGEQGGDPAPERKLLGSIKLQHTVGEQKLESVFPYYADSTAENLAAEADMFVKEKNIPSSHVPAIVAAALKKKTKVLEEAEEQARQKEERARQKKNKCREVQELKRETAP